MTGLHQILVLWFPLFIRNQKTRNRKVDQSRINTERILVPANSAKPILVPTAGEGQL